MNGEAGKGSVYRPVNPEVWEANYNRIFGKKTDDLPEEEDQTEEEKPSPSV